MDQLELVKKLERKIINHFYQKLELTREINFDIEEVGKPVKFNWGKCPLATASFGHGITTTLIQVVKGYSIIVNGGFNVNPTLIKKNKKKVKRKNFK